MQLIKKAKQPKYPVIVYTVPGLAGGTVRVSKSLLANGAAPETITLEGVDFAEPRAAKGPKVMTDEQKATARYKIVKAEARIAARRAKLGL